jgi:hypothetical protein
LKAGQNECKAFHPAVIEGHLHQKPNDDRKHRTLIGQSRDFGNTFLNLKRKMERSPEATK